jgi:hypothetical protein
MTASNAPGNEDIPNGQLMHLALEVMNQAIESNYNDEQSEGLTSEFKGISIPPVCAL